MQKYDLQKFSGADELASSAAAAWLDEIEAANRAGKRHSVALSGGRITQKFFAATVEQAKVRKISFASVHFFWADERCVPPTDPESNFKLADELLFRPLGISETNIHRLRGEDSPQAAVKIAEQELRQIVAAASQQLPVLELVLLGMGEDGHVASLFPNASEQNTDTAASFLVIEGSPKPPPTRISLTYGSIRAAGKVWVLAAGAGKAAALKESLSPVGDTPLARIVRTRAVKIFTDI